MLAHRTGHTPAALRDCTLLELWLMRHAVDARDEALAARNRPAKKKRR